MKFNETLSKNKISILVTLSLITLIGGIAFLGLYYSQIMALQSFVPPEDTTTVNTEALESHIDSLPKETLTDIEREGLLYMREEEKLARDVYMTFYDIYGSRIFNNIASSEQTHMDSVKLLLDRYELPDPAANTTTGVFNNQDLQNLYNQLITNGSVSLTEALKVGAIIEEVDIIDLDSYIAQTDQEDIQSIYELLRAGSYNHLRAFVSQLSNNDYTYTPSYITQERYEDILAQNTNKGNLYSEYVYSTTQPDPLYLIFGFIFVIAGVGTLMYLIGRNSVQN